MKKKTVKRLILAGVACVLLMAAACWYAVTFNDSRLVVPIDLSRYQFQPRDLPMILATLAVWGYFLCLFVLLLRSGLKKTSVRVARKISPKLGWLGFLGLLGFAGFYSYRQTGNVSPFLFFSFFGFFGFFYEGRMSGTLLDERFRENQQRAQSAACKTALTIIVVAALFLGQGRLFGKLDYTLIALLIVISLSFALDLFLGEYLLYRWDQEGETEEREE